MVPIMGRQMEENHLEGRMVYHTMVPRGKAPGGKPSGRKGGKPYYGY